MERIVTKPRDGDRRGGRPFKPAAAGRVGPVADLPPDLTISDEPPSLPICVEAVLDRAGLLVRLSPQVRRQVIQSARIRRLRPHHALYLEGDDGDSCFLIAEGRVRVRDDRHAAESSACRVVERGELFGVTAVLHGRPHAESALTLEPTILIEVPNAALCDDLRSILRECCGS